MVGLYILPYGLKHKELRKNAKSPKVVAKVLMSITHRGFLEYKNNFLEVKCDTQKM